MKKFQITRNAICIFLLLSFNANAKGPYLSIGYGYNLSLGQTTLGSNVTTSEEEIVSGTLGKGSSFGGTIGYMFNENIGAELGVSYLAGYEYNFTEQISTASYNETGTGKMSSSMFRLIPAIKLTVGNNVKPYAKFGLVIGLSPKVDQETDVSNSIYNDATKNNFYGGTSFGMTGAFGFDINASDNINVFTELNIISQSWAPSKEDYTETSLGNNQSYTITYSDKIQTNNNSVHESIYYYIPFSSVGLHVGIKFSLANKNSSAVKKVQ